MSLQELLSNRVLLIAEIGSNHNGDLRLAKKLIDAAVHAKADVAKFQTFLPDELVTRTAPKAEYLLASTNPNESQRDRLQRMRLSREQHLELKVYCEGKGIVFASSAFDFQSADLLEELDVPFHKIPSGELTNLPLIRHIASFERPIIMSTGMAELGEIEDALEAVGTHLRSNVVLLHCVSAYPAPWKDANLLAIRTLQEVFKLPVGFSDHAESITLALVAVGLGVVVIEKHLTLDKGMEGGDHKASLEPHEFAQLVTNIRAIEGALGDGVKRCAPSERNTRIVARKSIVAKTFIRKGQQIEAEMITVKRPGGGIAPKFLPKILGMRAKEVIEADHLIAWEQIQ